MTRTIYYLSDGTGISAETLGHSLMTQFNQIRYQSVTLPYIDNPQKAQAALVRIDASYQADQIRPIVFSTIVKPEIRNIIAGSQGLVIDFFQSFIGILEQELNVHAQATVGLSHALINEEEYNTRIEAIDYALQCDDGVGLKFYDSADVILLGPSRCGKTPTCLYLALQFDIRAANYPLTEEDLPTLTLPPALSHHRSRLLGLTIEAERLHQIRSKRLPNSRYASLQQCQREIDAAIKLYQHENIAFLNSTHLSIEELAAHIVMIAGLRR